VGTPLPRTVPTVALLFRWAEVTALLGVNVTSKQYTLLFEVLRCTPLMPLAPARVTVVGMTLT
jgi:hypothetical protein